MRKPRELMGVMVACLLVALLAGGCGERGKSAPGGSGAGEAAAAGEAVYHKITAGEAKDIMDAGDPYILLDVRTAEEYQESHIDGAQLLPSGELADRAASELPDQQAVILVYCRSGARSAGAAKALVAMGYTNVYDMGGIIDWPYGTVSE